MNRFILALFWFVLAVETDSIQNVVQKTESGVVSEMSASIEESHAEGSSMHAVEKHGDVELETSLAAKGTPRRRRRDRRRRRRRRFRRRRRRRRRRATPSPTVAPTPMPTAAPTVPPTAAPTPAPTEAPTVKAGKGKGGSLLEEEDHDYAEDVSGSTPEESKAYFTMVDAHLKNSNKLEGDELEGDPLLIFCNGQAFEMDPSAGVTFMTGLNNANEVDAAKNAFDNQKIGLTMSAPLISTISQVLKTATVPPQPAAIKIWFESELEPDSLVRNMNEVTAAKYGLSVKWLKGMELASFF